MISRPIAFPHRGGRPDCRRSNNPHAQIQNPVLKRPMIETLLSLPGWVLSFAAGILLALVGLVVIRLLKLQGAWLRYLPLALVAVGYAAADRFLIPELMRSDLAHCSIARASADQTNAQRAGTQTDALTTFVAITADCTTKTLVTRYEVAAPRTDLDPTGLANTELMFTADTCGNPQLRRMITAGWRVENVYEFAAGEPLVMTAGC
jgi:hypothetical protein